MPLSLARASAPLPLLLLLLAASSLRVAARLTELHSDQIGETPPIPNALPCEKPVSKAPVVFPDELLLVPKAKQSFDMYSGYVNVTSQDYLFYWLAEKNPDFPSESFMKFQPPTSSGASSRGGPRSDDDIPLVIWSNGGPGCSAMEGASTEHGPYIAFDVKENKDMFNGKLTANPYAWNKLAHVLYVDQPRYVGFSTGTGEYVTSSVDAGKDMVTFILEWRKMFPEHAKRPIIVAAESYGGHYAPAWTGAIMDYNDATSNPADRIPLAGVLIGDGIVNGTVQNTDTFVAFQKSQGLIPQDAQPKSTGEARSMMADYLGYTPNYYDYRVIDLECCGCTSYNYKTWTDFLISAPVTAALNICGDAGENAFGGCSGGCISLPHFDRGDTFDYSGALTRALERGIKVSLYYGMQDTACDYAGGYALAKSLEWSGQEAFNAAPLVELPFGGGQTQAADGLTWIQVEGAGHMVPINEGVGGLYALGTLV